MIPAGSRPQMGASDDANAEFPHADYTNADYTNTHASKCGLDPAHARAHATAASQAQGIPHRFRRRRLVADE
jgi:hypothetical protein